jgi:hypothetical protein
MITPDFMEGAFTKDIRHAITGCGLQAHAKTDELNRLHLSTGSIRSLRNGSSDDDAD